MHWKEITHWQEKLTTVISPGWGWDEEVCPLQHSVPGLPHRAWRSGLPAGMGAHLTCPKEVRGPSPPAPTGVPPPCSRLPPGCRPHLLEMGPLSPFPTMASLQILYFSRARTSDLPENKAKRYFFVCLTLDDFSLIVMKVKENSEKAGLKLNIKNTKIMASGPITS